MAEQEIIREIEITNKSDKVCLVKVDCQKYNIIQQDSAQAIGNSQASSNSSSKSSEYSGSVSASGGVYSGSASYSQKNQNADSSSASTSNNKSKSGSVQKSFSEFMQAGFVQIKPNKTKPFAVPNNKLCYITVANTNINNWAVDVTKRSKFVFDGDDLDPVETKQKGVEEKEEKKETPKKPVFEIRKVSAYRYQSDKGSGAEKDIYFFRPSCKQNEYCIGIRAFQNDKNNVKIFVIYDPVGDLVAKPIKCEKIWSDKGGKSDQNNQLWRAVPPDGYVALSDIPNFYTDKDNGDDSWIGGKDAIWCVSKKLVKQTDSCNFQWNDNGTKANQDGSIWNVSYTDFMIASPSHKEPSGPFWRLIGQEI